jgi:hypothetical protein
MSSKKKITFLNTEGGSKYKSPCHSVAETIRVLTKLTNKPKPNSTGVGSGIVASSKAYYQIDLTGLAKGYTLKTNKLLCYPPKLVPALSGLYH